VGTTLIKLEKLPLEEGPDPLVLVDPQCAVEAVPVNFIEMSLLYKERHDLHSKPDNVKRVVDGGKCPDEDPGDRNITKGPLLSFCCALPFSTIII
jgi:hypothetical protein